MPAATGARHRPRHRVDRPALRGLRRHRAGFDNPVQRFWRDAHAGRVHAANDPERAYLIFGSDDFGLPPQDTMV